MNVSAKLKTVPITLCAVLWICQLIAFAQDYKPALGVDTFAGNFSEQASPPSGALSLWYRQPAKNWIEALPVGNGRLGAMIFGGIEGERIQLNEDTLWGGSPYDPANPDALPALPEVRRLIFAEKYKEADMLIGERLMGKPFKQMPYQTVGDLRIGFPKTETVSAYRRELDLVRAIARVSYKIGETTFIREIFSSAVSNVIVIRLTANRKNQISFDAAMQTPQKAKVSKETADTLVMSGINGSAYGVEGRLKFQARIRVLVKGGKIDSACANSLVLSEPYSQSIFEEIPKPEQSKAIPVNSENCVSVKNADSATILINVATGYKNYHDISDDEAAKARTPIENAAKKSFESLRSEHIADYQKFFRRVSLDLGTTDAAKLPTDERIKNFAYAADPQLAALYFQFGRYLLISSSRPGTQPANLQGIWNDSMMPPWESKYTININTEMNYWLAEPTNLSEMTEPLARMVTDLTETGSKMAKAHWGAQGWVTHHNTDLWRATAPIDAPRYGMWSLGGAWLTLHLWEHYEYTEDKAYLEKIYPIMKGACEFFLDTLVEEPKNKYLVTNPSLSPENRHKFGTSVVAGPTMDSQILRDLFINTIRAGEILGRDKDFQAALVKTRARLAPNEIGKAGQLQEWLEDWDMEAPNLRHRHVSHLYGAYPSWQINVFETPELAEAAKKTLDKRGDETTGWAIAWRLNLWARLRDAERAYKILALLIRPERTYPNMFDAHPPFQIDGNFGGASGITEMLMQNRIIRGKVEIEFLPALPKAFSSGSVKGLRARRGFEIDIKWKYGKLMTATVRSLLGKPVRLRYGRTVREIDAQKGKSISWNGIQPSIN
jgi:alpha-L-fucosidase 2